MSNLPTPEASPRRSFLGRAVSWFMAGGLLAGYGACGAMGTRYLFPARPAARRWLFAARTSAIPVGGALAFETPSGERIAIARHSDQGTVEDFIALSSVCPHLGCQVHWQAAQDRFFCPCHNGVFNPSGEPVSGPPAEAKQALSRFPLKIEGELLYIEAPIEKLSGPERA